MATEQQRRWCSPDLRPERDVTADGIVFHDAIGRGVVSGSTPSLPPTVYVVVDAGTGDAVDGRFSRYADADSRCVELGAITGRLFRVVIERSA